MREIAIDEGAPDLPALVAEVEGSGEEIVLTRAGQPAVRLVPAEPLSAEAARRARVRELMRLRDELANTHPESARPISWEDLKADMEANR